MMRNAAVLLAGTLAVSPFAAAIANAETVTVHTAVPKVSVPETKPNEIHIESFSFGSTQTGSVGSTGGSGAGKVSTGDITPGGQATGKRGHKPLTLQLMNVPPPK